ncbi:ead/Ea22-like family protein [Pseudomonas aeruginosa]|uniref:ead/Ea22-like family protein n=1 Tax=Pseudomonas aeruginosa TaxID=287 RepID=UPI0015F095CB|nr:ead/Ea22-like family protein [Pseudomonas aeruginosa]MBA5058182.1 ead/Ea22-like family protein [Pseudomonas aeruginosa]HEO1562733.1 ead/Ea22-like family protein [Pseudomonas aeruginosa]
MTDTKNLKELAEKLAPAYQQPWESHRHSASAVTVGAVGEDGEYSDFIDVRISDYSAFDEHDDELGQWIAAANPKAILALLDEIDGLLAQHGRDSSELRALCQARDDARKERDRLKAENERLLDELSACTEHPGGCGYWREAAKRRAEERDRLKAENEALRESLQALIHISDATGWEDHTCGEIAKARAALEGAKP